MSRVWKLGLVVGISAALAGSGCVGSEPVAEVRAEVITPPPECGPLPVLRHLSEWDGSPLFTGTSRAAVIAFRFGRAGEQVAYGVDANRGTVVWAMYGNAEAMASFLGGLVLHESPGIPGGFVLDAGKVGPPPPPPGDPFAKASDLVQKGRSLLAAADQPLPVCGP